MNILKSILKKKDTIALLQKMQERAGLVFSVEDENGNLFFGEKRADHKSRLPIEVNGNTIGWVCSREKLENIADLLSLLANRESEKKILGAEVLDMYREINLIYNFSEKLTEAISPSSVSKLALREVGHLIDFCCAAVLLWDDEKQTANVIVNVGNNLLKHLLREKELVKELALSSQSAIEASKFQSENGQPLVLMHAPLKVKHRVMGTILLARDKNGAFDAAELKLLTTLALQSASAIESTLLLERSVWKTLELERERGEIEKIKEQGSMRTQFFTNITHEFRTPLTVILGMTAELERKLEQAVAKMPMLPDLQHTLTLVKRNGRNLLTLINQLLDLSKLDQGAFQLNLKQGDMVLFLRYLTESFQGYTSNQKLEFEFICSEWELVMDFDPDKLRQVLTNLISNAIKYTPPGGKVALLADHQSFGPQGFEDGSLVISVSDTGPGIPAKDLPYLFDRFYQVENSISGSGIGLAHSRELVKLMGGEISVESQVGHGSVFYVRLPVKREAEQVATNLKPKHSPLLKESAISFPEPSNLDSNLPIALLIEDNSDIVTYLQSCLNDSYQTIVAPNGQIGIDKAFETIPDIIISDVMMPWKNGFEVTEMLKTDERTSHIPIILLTAKTDVESRLDGLRQGADAYLGKPFNREELLLHMNNSIELRKRLRERFRDNIFSKNSNPSESPKEETAVREHAFIQKIKGILAENISDENFGLPQLCRMLGMSRSQLFRKMKALINESPSGFIRSYRLHQAKTMLQQTDLSVSEIGYEVGFKDPAHFSKTFQDAFGMPPSASRN